MRRITTIIPLLSAAAMLGGCVTPGGPDGPEWAVGIGGFPGDALGGPGLRGEVPIRDPSGREQTVLLGLGIAGPPEWGEGEYHYSEDIRVSYRQYHGLFGKQGPRRARVFWEAGVGAGTEYWGKYDPLRPPPDEKYFDTSNNVSLILGGGVRWWFPDMQNRLAGTGPSPIFMEISVNAATGMEYQPMVGFMLGWSFPRPEPGQPSLLERWREARQERRTRREQARLEVLAEREQAREDVTEPAPPRRRRTRAEIFKARAERQAEWRAERRADWRKGVLGMRAGMLLPASGEGVDFGQSMTLGLSYCYPAPHDPSFSHELTVDFGWPEEIGGYESRPVVVGFNVLLDVGDPTRQVKGRLVAGLGLMVESVKEQGTGTDYTNYTAVVNLGAGAVFAGGHLDTRLMYTVFAGSENLIGRARFTVTHNF